ncbi:supervillin-like isoform X11 [Cimex lectularius]|nr:supervillin-like isoform X11 [Cimex lectularius]
MVSPNLAGVCSPRPKKPTTTQPPSSSPIPRSAQLVKRQIASRNDRGLTPDSDPSPNNGKEQPLRLASLILSKSTPTSPAKHPSILKKSSLDESISNPVSILKRKTSHEEQAARCSSPLRFSPNVVERKGRGILKKHRSLDDPQVSRISPELVSLQDVEDHRPILKGQQRRCSLDEVVKRTDSPEPQGILKRKASREEVENCAAEPQGILKKKSSITDEPILESLDSPRPILKKKSSSEEEEQIAPVRPILKTWRKSLGDSELTPDFKRGDEVRPILKHPDVVMRNKKISQEKVVSLDLNLFRRSLPCGDEGKWLSVAERVNGLESFMSFIRSERPSSVELCCRMDEPEESSGKGLVRSGSVSERATIFSQLEQQEKMAAEAVRTKRNMRGPRSRGKIDGGRFSTQPVTFDEVEQAKRNNDPDCDEDPSRLTLAERVALFSKRGEDGGAQKAAQPLPPAMPKRLISHSMSGVLVEGLMKNLAHKDSGTKRLDLRPCQDADTEESATSSDTDLDEDEGKENRDVVRGILRKRKEDMSSEEASSGGKEILEMLNNNQNSGLKKSNSSAGSMLGEVTALRRCATQPIPRDEVDDLPKTTIAERLAALRKNGDNNWLKRITKPAADEEIICKPPSGGANRVSELMGQLDTASQGWKARVGLQDAMQFTVAGKMSADMQLPPAPKLGPANRKPRPVVFTKNGVSNLASASTPSVPESLTALMKRSISMPEDGEEEPAPCIQVPEPYDNNFSSFFVNADLSSLTSGCSSDLDVDFEEIAQTSHLLIQRRNVRVQRKHKSANPLRALAARTDLKSEYIEVKTGVADREIRRMNIEKLSRKSGMAVEALAGLASKEDLSAISLRKSIEPSPSVKQWCHPILLRVKGRRRPLTSVVRPHYTTINQGDSFILVTQSKVFHWIGEYSNVIEKSRGGDIALHIQTKKDLGCIYASAVSILDGSIFTEKHREFWKLLFLPDEMMGTYKGENAGHPGEDEVYEKAIAETFMVYSLSEERLLPVETYWGCCPKISVLDPAKILVFDFGSEVYLWAGKNASMKQRQQGNLLAQQLFKTGYHNNTSWQSTSITWLDDEMQLESRPDWSIITKVTQHMEPIIFKEKFVDWPDFTRVIKTKDGKGEDKHVDGSVNVHPCDYKAMLDWSIPYPDLILEGSHLGRGRRYYDEERRLNYEVTTKEVTVWQIHGTSKMPLEKSSLGNFLEGESYVIKWNYSISSCARELSGLPSRHVDLGRDRVAHIVWHGRKAPVLEQGTAALLTSLGVSSDEHEHGPILTVAQDTESPAFISFFPGPVVFHSPQHSRDDERLYLITGEADEECMLEEVPLSEDHLRSRASLWLLNITTGKSYLWHGAKSPEDKRKIAFRAVSYLRKNNPKEFGVNDALITIKEIEEGEEPLEFLGGLCQINRESYYSLIDIKADCDWTPRLYHLSSLLGNFTACPVIPPRHHPEFVTPYPYRKRDLYSTSQPSILLLDVGEELWLWCGWWEGELDARGTAWARHQAERKAGMTTALQYWSGRGKNPSSAFIVHAGLEPAKFKSYFSIWEDDYPEAREFNLEEGHKDGEAKRVQDELAELEVKCYPVSELTTHPLPGGVDPTRLECYLDPIDFKKLLGVTKEEFDELPVWKRTNLKKMACLF